MEHKRIAIYCFFDEKGIVGRDILYFLNDLKKNVDDIIIVVNGLLRDKEGFAQITNDVVFRENTGFDICAYKEIIFHPKYKERIRRCRELILCNSSVFGPFIPFSEIFEKMNSSNADFWGISSSEKNLIQHIQSYFLVYRKNILEGEVFYKYLHEHIDSGQLDYMGVCGAFENGLFHELIDNGYTFDAYVRDICCDNYSNPYGSLKIDGVPVLKKKVFSEKFFNENKALDSLSYISNTYSYDIDIILEFAKEKYGRALDKDIIAAHIRNEARENIISEEAFVERGELENFIENHNDIYIYGNGKMAEKVFNLFFYYPGNAKLKGFIVSDDQNVSDRIYQGYPVKRFSEIEDKGNIAVIVGMNKENALQIKSIVKGMHDTLYLWRELNNSKDQEVIGECTG